MTEKIKNEKDGPFDGKRFKIAGLHNRTQYVEVDTHGVLITFPDNKRENWNYQATATALARMISIFIRADIVTKSGLVENTTKTEYVKKQLSQSSMQEGDTPHVLLQAIEKYEAGK